ncbi:Head-to-tail connector protein, podovirus-type, partial [uncultured Caudovirales phage]
MDIEQLIHTYNTLKGNRGTWEQHWEEIAERILPRQIGFVGQRTDGEKRTQKVFDSKPMIALERFAAVMDSMLTPRQSRWHNLRTTNEDLNRDFAVQDWFYKVNNILYQSRYTPSANFSGQNSERWISTGAFGTGALFIDWDSGSATNEPGLRYRCVNLRD